MKCPVCQETLTMTERKGVEIDFCPKCRGVWLDRGELDKILERESSYQQAAQVLVFLSNSCYFQVTAELALAPEQSG